MEKGIRSGRYDDIAIALLVRVMDGLAAGQAASAVLQGLPLALPPADLAMADRLARATKEDLGELAIQWREWDDARKRSYMAAVLESWKVKKANEAANHSFAGRATAEDGLDVAAGGPERGDDGGEGL